MVRILNRIEIGILTSICLPALLMTKSVYFCVVRANTYLISDKMFHKITFYLFIASIYLSTTQLIAFLYMISFEMRSNNQPPQTF